MGSTFISQKVFIKSFCKGEFPPKSVNVSFIITHMKNRMTDLCRNPILQNNFENTFCEINLGSGSLLLRLDDLEELRKLNAPAAIVIHLLRLQGLGFGVYEFRVAPFLPLCSAPSRKLPCRQPRGKLMIFLVNSHTNATRIGWHLWEND